MKEAVGFIATASSGIWYDCCYTMYRIKFYVTQACVSQFVNKLFKGNKHTFYCSFLLCKEDAILKTRDMFQPSFSKAKCELLRPGQSGMLRISPESGRCILIRKQTNSEHSVPNKFAMAHCQAPASNVKLQHAMLKNLLRSVLNSKQPSNHNPLGLHRFGRDMIRCLSKCQCCRAILEGFSYSIGHR